ncbi:glycosyltransferase family 8 protein [Anaerosacchariphilus polymeriproducens]|uniref:Glycosyltransferase family 8 protein n=1 Tax=Anaerosacchariphilus polymeriproducens TaxID=1812858 RepID=A0A371ATE1_9FIRM|nr:glycosyltransferase family 8 protein [Anaerosacchariphilus polymeriproducens]RDU22809.1 glycosyltransferase family 8 protein [Anaerosacchariphilus polymeriproducens]
MKHQNMNILVTLDENYLSPLRVMLHSLFVNNKWAYIHVYLMHSSIPDIKLKELEKFIKSYQHTLKIIKVKDDIFEDAPKRLHITKETYYRLLVMDYLDERIERILYLDPDLIVNDSIKSFYHCNMEHAIFAGAADSFMNQKYNPHKQSLGLPTTKTYINAGVLLINVKKLRRFTDTNKIIDEIYNNYDKLKVQDQDLVNMLFYPYIKIVSNRFNRDANFQNMKERWEYPLIRLKQCFQKQNIIIHYLGPQKPWKKNYGGKFLIEYWKYARKVSDRKMKKIVKANFKTWMYDWIKVTD